jgi:vacuolar-type H+-ATPase subunit E/Vma4
MDAAASAEESRLLEAARNEAARLMAAAADEATVAREQQLRQAAAELRPARARLESDVRLRVAMEQARLRDALVEEAFTRAWETLMNARETEQYAPTLQALLGEALGQFPSGKALQVRCDPRDVPLLASLIRETDRDVFLDSSLTCWGGLIVQDIGSEVVADNTLEHRLERARDRLWPQVAELVLGLQ